MKLILIHGIKRLLLSIWFFTVLLLAPQADQAQICANPGTIIYGLTNSGFIYPINAGTANVGAVVNPGYNGNNPAASNGIGYNPTNGRFYFFKRNTDQSPQEFCVFDPGTMGYTIKASCPTINAINTGCVTNTGLGYYTIDVNGNLYYYDILLNTWTFITGTLIDQFNNNFSSIIAIHSSGDIAIDGGGNLWIVCSSSTEFGLYKLSAPLPTTAQASLTLRRLLVPTTPTPTGNSFAGIAFNPTGQIFLSTSADNRLYRLENNYSLTNLGVFSLNNVGADLTSCNFPLGVLPIKWESFTAALNESGDVRLDWTVSNEVNYPAFYVEHSTDGRTWRNLGTVRSNKDLGSIDKLIFTHFTPGPGIHQYRIRQNGVTGQSVYSEIRTVNIKSDGQLAIWPNPAKDEISIQDEMKAGNSITRARIFDQSGKEVKQFNLQPGTNTVNVSSLKQGIYIVQMQFPNGQNRNQKLIKQ